MPCKSHEQAPCCTRVPWTASSRLRDEFAGVQVRFVCAYNPFPTSPHVPRTVLNSFRGMPCNSDQQAPWFTHAPYTVSLQPCDGFASGLVRSVRVSILFPTSPHAPETVRWNLLGARLPRPPLLWTWARSTSGVQGANQCASARFSDDRYVLLFPFERVLNVAERRPRSSSASTLLYPVAGAAHLRFPRPVLSELWAVLRASWCIECALS